jgi:hypothetical protein
LFLFHALISGRTSVLSTLAPYHPRLLLTDDGLGRLQNDMACDPVLRRYASDIIARAERDCSAPPLRDDRTPTLIGTSRECLDRVYSLAVAWRLTKQRRFATAAIDNIETVCAFHDWNPSHFLDTAEMIHAVAVGYDWLFEELDPASRSRIREALLRKGLETGLRIYEDATEWWVESPFNWNLVCNGGLLIGALALGNPSHRTADTESVVDHRSRTGDDSRIAEAVAERAIAALRIALASYKEDGAWPEGPVYWHLATRYVAYTLSAMKTALGDCRGLDEMPGLAQTGHFPIYLSGPTGQYLNFADSREKSQSGSLPCSFWLSRTYGDASFADEEHAQLRDRPARPEHLVWYVPPSDRRPARKLDRLFRGIVDVAALRSSWDDPEALFIGVQSGSHAVAHGHLDAGGFEFDALGVRWARDLGADDYGLHGYWAGHDGGRRWTYYRLHSRSHNLVTLDGRDYDLGARGRIVGLQSRQDSASVVFELDGAWPGRAKWLRRGIAMVAARSAVLVQDELDLTRAAEVAWGMTTDAEIELVTDQQAMLSMDGRRLEVQVLSSDARFAVESAEREPPENENVGVRRLVARVAAAPGPLRLAVLLAPASRIAAAKVPILPLSEWCR